MIDIYPCSDIGYSEEYQWKKEKFDDLFADEEPEDPNEKKDPLGEE